MLEPDRELIYARIESRFDAMMTRGALDEARDLWERQLDPALPCLKAHGMPGFIAFFEGHTSLEAAIARAILDTRHYAKRQLTWLRGRAASWPRATV